MTALASMVAAIGVVGGLIFAIFQLRQQAKITKQKNTIDIILLLLVDKSIEEASAIVTFIPNKKLKKYAQPMTASSRGKMTKKEREEEKSIYSFLSFLEWMSIGIVEDLYDKDIFRKTMRGYLIAAYSKTKPFIDEIHKLYSKEDFKYFVQVAVEFQEEIEREKSEK